MRLFWTTLLAVPAVLLVAVAAPGPTLTGVVTAAVGLQLRQAPRWMWIRRPRLLRSAWWRSR